LSALTEAHAGFLSSSWWWAVGYSEISQLAGL